MQNSKVGGVTLKKYDNILKRVEQVEYKLGVSYAKTKGKLYGGLWKANLIGVIYLFVINALVVTSTLMNKAAGIAYNVKFSNLHIVLICVFTVLPIAGLVLSKLKLEIIGSALSFVSIPYFCFLYIKVCISSDGEGLFGLIKLFYIRHLPSIMIILITASVMLFIAIREKIKVNRMYKRIIENLYKNYADKKKSEDKEVSDEDWKDFIKHYSPKTMKL